MRSSSETRHAYRLRGLVRGAERVFNLGAGEHRIGRAQASDIVLPVEGVSRHHAVLRILPEGLEIEDAGSHNGTYVDDRRVTRTLVPAGAELTFGAVRLLVERADRDDVELAFELTSTTGLSGLFPETEEGTQTVNLPETAPPERAPELAFPEGYRPGTSTPATDMHRRLEGAARSDLATLIVGETGVGKEQVARTVHASSSHSEGPFVAVNCAAIPSDMLEAEMFGIGKGVATGVTQRPGKFQLAEGGTLFLDEISEMQPALQAKLLRALEEKEIQPVGGRARKIDVRLVAATNADLERLTGNNTFRRDLFFRLAGHLIEVPPLRSAREDIPGLVEHFLRTFSLETGTRVRGLTAKALRLLETYPWPGNVRELQHEMHRLVDSSVDGQVIDSGMLAPRLQALQAPQSPAPPIEDGESLALGSRLGELEERLIREALRQSEGNQAAAARLLGISRNGLAKKLERHGIRARRLVSDVARE